MRGIVPNRDFDNKRAMKLLHPLLNGFLRVLVFWFVRDGSPVINGTELHHEGHKVHKVGKKSGFLGFFLCDRRVISTR